MEENEVLNRVAVEQLLAGIEAQDRLVIELTYGLMVPKDWPWPIQRWPPTFAEIGWYVGMHFRNKPLSEASIRYMKKRALASLNQLQSEDLL